MIPSTGYDDFSATPPLCEGWLEKCGLGRSVMSKKGWSRRYFFLTSKGLGYRHTNPRVVARSKLRKRCIENEYTSSTSGTTTMIGVLDEQPLPPLSPSLARCFIPFRRPTRHREAQLLPVYLIRNVNATDHPYAPRWCINGVCFDYVVHTRPVVVKAASITPTSDLMYRHSIHNRSGSSFLASTQHSYTAYPTLFSGLISNTASSATAAAAVCSHCSHCCSGESSDERMFRSCLAQSHRVVGGGVRTKEDSNHLHDTAMESRLDIYDRWVGTNYSGIDHTVSVSGITSTVATSTTTHASVNTRISESHTTLPMISVSNRDHGRILSGVSHIDPTMVDVSNVSDHPVDAVRSCVVEMYHFAISFEERRRRYLLLLRTSDICEYIKWTTCLVMYMHEGSVYPTRALDLPHDVACSLNRVHAKCTDGKGNNSIASTSHYCSSGHVSCRYDCAVKGMYRAGIAPECAVPRSPCGTTEISRALNRRLCLQWDEGGYARVMRGVVHRLRSVRNCVHSVPYNDLLISNILWPPTKYSEERDANECTFYGI